MLKIHRPEDLEFRRRVSIFLTDTNGQASLRSIFKTSIARSCSQAELASMYRAHPDTIAASAARRSAPAGSVSAPETPIRITVPALASAIKAAFRHGPGARKVVIDTFVKMCTHREVSELNDAYAAGEPERAKRRRDAEAAALVTEARPHDEGAEHAAEQAEVKRARLTRQRLYGRRREATRKAAASDTELEGGASGSRQMLEQFQQTHALRAAEMAQLDGGVATRSADKERETGPAKDTVFNPDGLTSEEFFARWRRASGLSNWQPGEAPPISPLTPEVQELEPKPEPPKETRKRQRDHGTDVDGGLRRSKRLARGGQARGGDHGDAASSSSSSNPSQ